MDRVDNQESFWAKSGQFSQLLLFLGAVAGVTSAGLALSGDGDNQVNLFWLLFLFVFIPVAGLFVSLYEWLFRKVKLLAKIRNYLFLFLYVLLFQDGWRKRYGAFKWMEREHAQDIVAGSEHGAKGKFWFIYQMQVFYMAFSTACVIVYLLVLSFSDIKISWSSTLFDADHFLPFLQWVAWPWSHFAFFEEAQPSLDLLACTRKLFQGECSGWHWWRYVFAALLFYNLMPRVALFFGTRWRFNLALKRGEIPRNLPEVQHEQAAKWWPLAMQKLLRRGKGVKENTKKSWGAMKNSSAAVASKYKDVMDKAKDADLPGRVSDFKGKAKDHAAKVAEKMKGMHGKSREWVASKRIKMNAKKDSETEEDRGE